MLTPNLPLQTKPHSPIRRTHAHGTENQSVPNGSLDRWLHRRKNDPHRTWLPNPATNQPCHLQPRLQLPGRTADDHGIPNRPKCSSLRRSQGYTVPRPFRHVQPVLLKHLMNVLPLKLTCYNNRQAHQYDRAGYDNQISDHTASNIFAGTRQRVNPALTIINLRLILSTLPVTNCPVRLFVNFTVQPRLRLRRDWVVN